VIRCVQISYDAGFRRVDGFATIVDADGGGSYWVDVIYTRILQCNSAGGACNIEVVNTMRWDTGSGGPGEHADGGWSGPMYCGFGATIRAETRVAWNDTRTSDGTTEQTIRSGTFIC
jgi:hypothetical protein